MATATTRLVSVRLAVIDGDKARREFTLTGDAAERALARIRNATAPASKSLVAINAISTELRYDLENLAGSAGSVGGVIARLGPIGLAVAAVLGGLAIAATKGAQEFAKAEQSANRLNTALKATEFAAGITARQISDLAGELERTTLFNGEQIQDGATALLYFRNISGETFKEAIKVTLDLAQAMNTDVVPAAQMLGRALSDPEEGIKKLEGVIGELNFEEGELIKQFVATNNIAAAQKIILDKLKGSIGDQAEGANKGLTGATNSLSDAWSGLLKKIGQSVTEFPAAASSLDFLTATVDRARKRLKPTRAEELSNLKDDIDFFKNYTGRLDVGLMGEDAPYISMRKKRIREIEAQLAQEREKAEKDDAEKALKAREAQAGRERDVLLRIEDQFQKELKQKTQTEREKAIEEAVNAKKRIDDHFKADSNTEVAARARTAVDANLRATLAKLDEEAAKPALRLAEANQKVAESLQKRLAVESIKDPRKRFIQDEAGKLNEKATPAQRAEVEDIAGQLFDQQALDKAAEKRKAAIEKINQEVLQTKPSYDVAKQALDEWKQQLIADLGGASDANQQYLALIEQIYSVKLKDIYYKSLLDSERWADGAIRALQRYSEEATNAAKNAETAFGSAAQKIEDALVDAFSTGEISLKSFGDVVSSISQDFTRSFIRQNITGPLAGAAGSLFDTRSLWRLPDTGDVVNSGGGFFADILASIFHEGGKVGISSAPQRSLPASTFINAPRFHNGLMPDEFPAILQRGETVLPKNQRMMGGGMTVNFNINTPNAQSFMQPESRGQMLSKFAGEMQRMRARNG